MRRRYRIGRAEAKKTKVPIAISLLQIRDRLEAIFKILLVSVVREKEILFAAPRYFGGMIQEVLHGRWVHSTSCAEQSVELHSGARSAGLRERRDGLA
jgi:hypothetical protein